MMKILHIHPSMAGGGIEAMITALANEMANQGHDVTVCSIFKPSKQDVFWGKLNNRVRKTDLGKTKKGFAPKNVFQIYNLIRKGGFDVVHIHGFFYYHALSVLLLSKKVTFFYTVHNDANMESFGWDRRFMFLKKWAIRHHLINAITISHASEESFEKVYGIQGRLIYNGVPHPVIKGEQNPVDAARMTADTKVFINPGRISAQKNQVVLCRVFEKIIKEGNDVVLLIAGSNDTPEIHNELEAYFSDRIKYIGLRKDVPELMAKADAFCLSSLWEGMPVTLLEALSVGSIPICTPVGGIVNVVHDGVNGILSESSDEEAYYSAIQRFLHMTTEEKEKMKANCIASFEPYDIRNTAKNYLEYYKEIQL